MTTDETIILYTSDFCGHAWAVERFMETHEIPVETINISQDMEARERLLEINGGYASVPTVVFPDGGKLTEPSFGELRARLGIEGEGLIDKIRSLMSGA